MEETQAEANPIVASDPELNQLLGLFDLPAFARRGQDLEYALGRLHARCRREREERLDMVRLRLRQWASVAASPDAARGVFAAPLDPLWSMSGAEPPAWATEEAPLRRRRAVARELIAAVVRFNRRWRQFLDDLNLDPVNQMIEHYNRYYLLEKECCLGSSRLAARHFVPKPRMTTDTLLAECPLLPVPEFRERD